MKLTRLCLTIQMINETQQALMSCLFPSGVHVSIDVNTKPTMKAHQDGSLRMLNHHELPTLRVRTGPRINVSTWAFRN